MAIDDSTVASIVTREIDQAESWMDSELSQQQAENLKYYFAEPFGNEKPGHSQVVTRDVMETVEGIMPELMKIFASDDSVVQFEPEGSDDVEAAEQATDYLNYVYGRRLGGFSLTYNWCKDALLMKNSVVKVGWASEDEVSFHTFEGLTPEEKAILEEEEGVEIDSEEDDVVRVRRTVEGGQAFIEHIPSEEFLIKERSRSIKEADFVGHKTLKTVGEMVAAGFEEDDLQASSTSSTLSGKDAVSDARFSDPQEGTSVSQAIGTDFEREVEVADVYLKLYDEDEERVKIEHVIQVGHNILLREEVDSVPLISLSPIMMPHKFTGVSVADLVTDIQEINSTLFRQTLDNLALTNAGRYAVVDGQANLQDLLDNKIGGVVRMKTQGAVQRLDTPQLSSFTGSMMEKLDLQRENRTGVSRMTQGLDPNALTSNTAATAVNQVMTAAQGKILLIARVFAETGFKELFWQLYRLVRTHQTKSDIVKLRGRFVEVNPFDWKDRKDMVVTVGIGNGNKDQQLFHLNNIGNTIQTIAGSSAGYMVSDQNVYNLAREMIKNGGFKNTDQFISDPSQIEKPEPQPDPAMVEAQGEAAKDQSEVQLNDAKSKQIVANTALSERELALKERTQALEEAKFEWEQKVQATEAIIEAEQDRAVGIGNGQ